MSKRKLAELKPNPKNPRKATDFKLELLQKSFEHFGSLSGVIYNRRTKRLVGGHQTSKTFKDAEVTIEHQHEPPTAKGTVAEGYVLIDGERHPYREVDWDEQMEHAANIAANKRRPMGLRRPGRYDA